MESTHTHGTGFLDRATAALLPAESLSKWLSAAGMGVFMLMVFLTFVDVFLRYWFGKSINGTVEITELMMVIVVFSSIAYTQWQKSHVTMDILTSKLTEPRRALLAVATTLWSLATIGFCSYTTARYAASTSSVTLVLRIPLTPFIGLASFGFTLLAVTLLHDLLKALSEACRRAGNRQALLALCLGCLPMLGAWWVATHKLPGMGSVAVGVLGLVFLFALFFLGMPVAFALMATGLTFIANLRGVSAGFTTLGKSMYATASSYAWSPLMFGAVVGDVLAGSIAMAAIALPEMRKHGYNDELAVGTLACSGTIGCLIPPSTTFIIYGVLAQQSIGDLFVAGIIPGLLCALCFMAAVWLMVFLKPGLAPRLSKSPLHERMVSLRTGLPIMGIFFLVIGGIYGGVFTATEGGGIGAFGTLLLALCMRRMNGKNFIATLHDSAKFISMCFTVLCGAIVLSYFMAMTRIPMVLANSIAALDVAPMLVLFAIVMTFCILGCFLPSMPLLLICVPIFVPIAKVFGWDLIWFGVIITVLDNMASITPPFGISLFVMKEVAGVTLGAMYRSAVPFVIALFVCLLLIVLFPSLATYLPTLMNG